MVKSVSRKTFLFYALSLFFCFSSFYSICSFAQQKNSLSWFTLSPRLVLSAYTGNDNLANGDFLLPLINVNSDMVLFGNVQGKTGFNGNWSGSFGLGYRQVYEDQNIVGFYAFLDRSKSSLERYYWIASPGIEFLGKSWDFRLNTYFPVGKSQSYLGSDWADNFQNYDYLQYKEHIAKDRYFSLYQHIGKGGDFEVGHVVPFFREAKIYGGGYYLNFAGNASSIVGFSGRIELPLQSHCKLELRYTNDNVLHEMTGIGLQFTFGGMSENNHLDIRHRLLDPIERNLATNNKGIGVVARETYKNVPAPNAGIERENIWFYSATEGEDFDSSKGIENCTFEHPCKNFKQADVDAIFQLIPSAYFYFAPGIYSLDGQLSAYNGQGFFGRSAGYKLPAKGDERSLFMGSFHLTGSSILDSLRLINNANHPQNVAIELDGQGNSTLNNILIGTIAGNTSYPIGIQSHSAFFNLTNSTVFAFSNNENIAAAGIWVDRAAGNKVSLTNDTIYALNQTISNSSDINAYGIYAISSQGSNQITINNSQINVNASVDAVAATADISAVALAITGQTGNELSINQSTLNAASKGNSNASAIGIITSAVDGNNTLHLTGSNINTQTNGNFSAFAEGIASYSFSGKNFITLTQSHIAAKGSSPDSATAYGILAYANSLEANQIIDSNSFISGIADSPSTAIQANIKMMG